MEQAKAPRLADSSNTPEDKPGAVTSNQDEAPPAVLNDEQKEQLLAAIEEIRRSTKNVNTCCLGWKLDSSLEVPSL